MKTNLHFTFLALLFLLPGLSWAEDICIDHPELCANQENIRSDKKIDKKRKVKNSPNKKSRLIGQEKTEKVCMQDSEDPFACDEAAAAAAEMIDEAMAEDARFGSKEERELPADESYATKPRRHDLNIDQYLSTNASHPALALKTTQSQNAFVTPTRRTPASMATLNPMNGDPTTLNPGSNKNEDARTELRPEAKPEPPQSDDLTSR